ncbi:MAG: TolC family protein [Duncaniella sp.]|nr:TolC family protein [Duncaniella sp.]
MTLITQRLYALAVASLIIRLAAPAITIDEARAVEMALENSKEMKMAQNAVSQAALNRGIARTAYLPDFSGSALGIWRAPDSQSDMGITLRMRGVYMAGISLTQPIFAGGKIIAANKLAGIGQTVADQQLRQTRINVSANAIVAYWSYVAVLAKVDMMESYRALVDTAYRQTLAAVDAGMATRNQLLRIEARRSSVVYQQEQVAGGAELCRMALCTALGLPNDTPVAIADSVIPSELPDGLESYDLDNRPEMQLLRADIEAKRQQVRMARADFLPQVVLQGGWSAYGNMKLTMMQQLPDGNYMPVTQKINENGWNIMLGVQVPIFHWGEGLKKVKHAKLDVDNALLSLDHNADLLDLQVKQAITNVRTGAELVRSANTAVSQAEAALNSTSEAYSLGLTPITDLLDAQAQWHSARANLIEAQTQLRINIVDYRSATATL